MISKNEINANFLFTNELSYVIFILNTYSSEKMVLNQKNHCVQKMDLDELMWEQDVFGYQ